MNDHSFQILELVLFGISVGLSMLFSGVETGITSLNPLGLRRKADKGSAKAKRLEELLNFKEDLITLCLIGNNIALVAAAALGTSLAISWWGSMGAVYSTIIVTAVLLVVGEIFPKSFVLTRGEWLMEKVSGALFLGLKAFHPLAKLPRWFTQYANLLAGNGTSKRSLFSREDLGDLLENEEVSLHQEEIKTLSKLFNLDQVTVRKVMVPLPDVKTVLLQSTVTQAIALMKSSGYSRLPVVGSTQEIGRAHV